MPIVRLVNPRHSHGGRAGSWRFSAVEGGIEDMKHRRFRVRHHRHNPHFFGYAHHRRHRHHNPFDQGTMVTAAWALAGGVAASWLPSVVVSSMNTGWTGVLATGVSAVALGWAGEKFAGKNAGDGLLIGGLVATGGKLIAQLLGKNLVTFGMGQYTQTFFGPPYNSTGILQNTPNPYTPPPAAHSGTAAAMSGLLGRTTKFRSKFAR
jgi:hypothetical protein